jgi:L-serine dehydratase
MEKLYPEFYNDVFGPIMHPGSSSRMAGPCRAGFLCHCLLGEDVASIRVEFDKTSSFADMFGFMNEDVGLLNGVLGRLPDAEDFFEIKEKLKQRAIPYEFVFNEMKECLHPNAMKIILTGVSGRAASMVAISTGGGMVKITKINGYDFEGYGDTYVIAVFDPGGNLASETLSHIISKEQEPLSAGTGSNGKGGILHWFLMEQEPDPNLRNAFPGIEISVLEPVLPVRTTRSKKPQLFSTFTAWRRVAEERDMSLYETAIAYKIAASGWTREEVVAYMRDVVAKAMHRRIHALYDEKITPVESSFFPDYTKSWQECSAKHHLVSGAIARSIYYFNGVWAKLPGVLDVPGPMWSGGGIIYSVLSSVATEYKLDDRAVLRGLFIAAAVGAICYTNTEPTGEVIGCAGECGVCAAMAAAAVVEMLDGSPAQVETAATLALLATIGWPCDPIIGGLDQPCLSRAMYVAVMPLVYAQWALAGMDPVISFDEALETADRVGRSLPKELHCSGHGGVCATKSARKCRAEYERWQMTKF